MDGKFGFGPQEGDDQVKHRYFQGSSDNNGKISWDDGNGDGEYGDPDPNCEYFHNCMECQGTVTPSGVTTEVSFDFHREEQSKYWYIFGDKDDPWTLDYDRTDKWYEDDWREDDEDKSVSSADHIYQTDGPGFRDRDRLGGDYLFFPANLREWVTVQIDETPCQCSDFCKWHSQVYLKPRSYFHLTRGKTQQELGEGWMTMPSSPPSPAPE